MTKTGLIALALCCVSFQAFAQDSAIDTQDRLSLGLGIYDVGGDDSAIDLRAEHRWGTPLWWEIKPYAGGEITSDGSIWAGGGVYADFYVDEHLILTPSLGAGLYSDGSSDLDLGHPIEFRSQIEATYEFEDMNRVGIGFAHISNAGLDNENPGTEVLNLYWHMPY